MSSFAVVLLGSWDLSKAGRNLIYGGWYFKLLPTVNLRVRRRRLHNPSGCKCVELTLIEAPIAPISSKTSCDPNHCITATVVVKSRYCVSGFSILDRLAKSTMLLEQLLREIMNETDPEKYDELGAEIWRVLHERETLTDQSSLGNKKCQ